VAAVVGQVLSTFDIGAGPIKLSAVGPESQFVDDLGFDSLDSTELLLEVEEKFGIEISDEVLQREKIANIRGLVIAFYKLTTSAN
jgi:acyl carrier protein